MNNVRRVCLPRWLRRNMTTVMATIKSLTNCIHIIIIIIINISVYLYILFLLFFFSLVSLKPWVCLTFSS